MQDLLTLTLETLAIATTLMMFADFFCGLSHLYYACATTTQDKAEEAMVATKSRSAEEIVIAVEPTQGDPDETTPLDDPWVGEIEVINQCCCKSELPSVVYLLSGNS